MPWIFAFFVYCFSLQIFVWCDIFSRFLIHFFRAKLFETKEITKSNVWMDRAAFISTREINFHFSIWNTRLRILSRDVTKSESNFQLNFFFLLISLTRDEHYSENNWNRKKKKNSSESRQQIADLESTLRQLINSETDGNRKRLELWAFSIYPLVAVSFVSFPQIHFSSIIQVGPLPWLGPFTDDAIKGYVKHGKKHFILIPVAFVNEHIETLHEMDIEYCHDLGKEVKS